MNEKKKKKEEEEENVEGPMSSHTEYVIIVINLPLDAAKTLPVRRLDLKFLRCEISKRVMLLFELWLSLLRISYELEKLLHFDEFVLLLVDTIF